eukprot:gene31426-40820_t
MSTIRSVQSLPISQSLLDKLESHGFRYVSDLKDVKPFDLVSELGVSPSIAMSILETAKQSLLSTTSTSAENIVVDDFASKPVINSVKITAKDLLTKYTTKNRPIITFCKSLDAILGGGVQIGQITEFCGVPGIGKTQLAIQLALNAQIAEVFGGNAGEAVYIDTEGSFMPERAAEMATELSSHLRKIAKISESRKIENFASQKVAAESLTMERFLEGINVFRCHDQIELLATINHLFAYLKLKPQVRIVIIDSIAFHFRQDVADAAARGRVLGSMAQTLHQLAYDYDIAVVVINHVTTKFDKPSTSSESAGDSGNAVLRRLAPALGDLWSHSVTSRVMMYWHSAVTSDGDPQTQTQQRRASLVKSPMMPPAHALFRVFEKGIRDVDE